MLKLDVATGFHPHKSWPSFSFYKQTTVFFFSSKPPFVDVVTVLRDHIENNNTKLIKLFLKNRNFLKTKVWPQLLFSFFCLTFIWQQENKFQLYCLPRLASWWGCVLLLQIRRGCCCYTRFKKTPHVMKGRGITNTHTKNFASSIFNRILSHSNSLEKKFLRKLWNLIMLREQTVNLRD